jgi:uncharacterized membrane protein
LILAPFFFIYLFTKLTTEAFEEIGFSRIGAIMIVIGCAIGSMINIPLKETIVDHHSVAIAVNVGGCLLPMIVSAEVAIRKWKNIGRMVIGICIVMILTYMAARPIPGKGIVCPFYLPPLFASICGFLARERRSIPSVAYVSGTIGTLLGADIIHLLDGKTLSKLATSDITLSIGGAGIFDGIFLTGILAVIIAAFIARHDNH